MEQKALACLFIPLQEEVNFKLHTVRMMVGSTKDHNIKEKRHRNAHVLLRDGGNVHTLILRVTDIDGTETDHKHYSFSTLMASLSIVRFTSSCATTPSTTLA